MTKIDIISGFLGAGKTTLIKKLLEEKAFAKDKLVLIENEFGEIGIDGAVFKNHGIEIKEMNSGCICCSIAGDFKKALHEIMKRYQPDRIIIEPSGVGKLSDVIKGCKQFTEDNAVTVNICMTVVDAEKYRMYMENFAEFYSDQIKQAKTIILSRTKSMKPEKLEQTITDIKKYNKLAPFIITEWDLLSGVEIVKLAEDSKRYFIEHSLLNEVKSMVKLTQRTWKLPKDWKPGSIDKQHHHANDVFSVWSKETSKIFDYRQLKEALSKLDYLQGSVLRAKGIVRTDQNQWIQFDYVPGENTIKETAADVAGRICVIGEHINDLELAGLFGLEK